MTFGEKLKKLRTDNQMTQEQLAEKIFVSRTAISKWETDRGYPGIDSLKALSDLFQIKIDDLISGADAENKKLLDEKLARRFYFAAVAFLGITVLFALLTYCLKQPYYSFGSVAGAVGYVVFGLLSKPKYKRLQARKRVVPYVLSRIILSAFVIGMVVYTIVAAM